MISSTFLETSAARAHHSSVRDRDEHGAMPCALFFDQLRELYSMEMQLSENLPALAELASDRELREMIQMHAFRTTKRAARLASIFAKYHVELEPDLNEAIGGLVKSGSRQLKAAADTSSRDMVLVAHCQRIQHFGLAGYSVALNLATTKEFDDEATLLECPDVEHRTAIRRLERIGARLFGEKSDGSASTSVFAQLFA